MEPKAPAFTSSISVPPVRPFKGAQSVLGETTGWKPMLPYAVQDALRTPLKIGDFKK